MRLGLITWLLLCLTLILSTLTNFYLGRRLQVTREALQVSVNQTKSAIRAGQRAVKVFDELWNVCTR